MKLLAMMLAILASTVAKASGWDYSQWPWLDGIKRDIQMTRAEGESYYKVMQIFAKNEPAFRAAIKDGYDSVPWARSAPCATTTSAVLEHSLKRAAVKSLSDRFAYFADIFGQHDKFGPTHNVEIMLYRMGWVYWPLSQYKVQVGIGLLAGRFTWNGVPMHSGHIYTTFGMSPDGEVLIGDNGGYNHPYRGGGYKAGTEGMWLPPGVVPERL